MKMKTLFLTAMTLTVLALVGCGHNTDNASDTNAKPAAGEMPSTNAMAPAVPTVPAETNVPAVTNQ